MTAERETLVREVDTLTRVNTLKIQILSRLNESKILFKKEIEEYFLGEVKVLPFPRKNAREYIFKLHRSAFGEDTSNWDVDITDKKVSIPWESLLPYQLIRDIAAYPTDPGKTVHIRDIIHKGSRFNISFIKYIDESIVGIIQKIPDDPGHGQDFDPATLDVEQYGQLSQEEKEEIFLKYFKAYPRVREKVLFNFYVNVLPEPGILKEVS